MATATQLERWIVGGFGFLSVLGDVAVPGFRTMGEIIAAGAVGPRTVFPYSTTWINAVALVVYAWPKSDWPVAIVNIIAAVVETVYCSIYIRYSAGRNRIIACGMALFQVAIAVTLVVVQLKFFANGQHDKQREQIFGWIGAASAILMYISPAKETYVAWSTHNAEELSLGLSLAFLANASIWLGYAFIDPFNLYYVVANGSGMLSAALQAGVRLYCTYYPAAAAQ